MYRDEVLMEKENLSLFNRDKYTDLALNLEAEAIKALKNTIHSYLLQGASIREISHVLVLAITMMECEIVLTSQSLQKEISKLTAEELGV
jgi:hypothetical protein